MGLSMAERRSVTKAMMKRYAAASKAQKSPILDELCALTGWSRRHARRALTHGHAEVRRQPKRAVVYDDHVLVPLRKVWAVLGGPCGKRLAPFMAEIVAALERHDELDLDASTKAKLLAISPATIDRVLAPERRRLAVKGPCRHQTRQPAPEPGPDTHLRRLGRRCARFLRGRPGRPRRWQCTG